MTPTWTIADARNAGACYDDDKLTALWAGRESLSVLDILDLDIPDADKMWAASRMLQGTSAGEAARIATLTRVITAYALPHPSTKAWAEAWLSGTDRSASAARAAGAAWAARAARAASAAWAAEAAWAAWAEAAEAAAAAEYRHQIADVQAALEAQR